MSETPNNNASQPGQPEAGAAVEAKPDESLVRLSAVPPSGDDVRFTTGIAGLDECLAEDEEAPKGIPDGTSIFLSGMPGSGKSTITTVMSAMNLGEHSDVIVFHGEEPAKRVRKRWDRLGLSGDPLLAPLGELDDALKIIRKIQGKSPRLVAIFDSVQCLSVDGKTRPEVQSYAAEVLMAQVTSAGGIAVLINHVDKGGQQHAGASNLPHKADIHLHITVNAKKGERFLEVRKNRAGRAGFQVPVTITANSISIGSPQPLSNNPLMAQARTNLERAAAKAYELLKEGETLSGYDFDRAGFSCSGGLWRAGLEMATKYLSREAEENKVDGKVPWTVIEEKIAGRKSYRLDNPPNKPAETPGEEIPPPQSGEPTMASQIELV